MMLVCAMAFAAGEAEFAAANTALAGGDLAAAESGYRAALVAGAVDADVYYDLGNVLYREDRHPLAILAWRRALALAPRDADARANLEFARRNVPESAEGEDPHPVWAPWQSALTGAEGQWFGAVVAGLGLSAVALRRRFPNAPVLAPGLVVTAIGLWIAAGGAAESALPAGGVVLVPSVTASSDLGGGVDLFTLHAGAEVGVLEVSAGRVLVALEDGRKGWIPEGDLGRVDPWAPMPPAG